jgi:hypothetical protein
MNNVDPAGRLMDPGCRLLEIWQDPQVIGYARRTAGDRDAADDALQSTYYLIFRLKHLAEIENLKAYFYQVLRREIARERGELGAILVEDFDRAAEDRKPVTCASDKTSAGFEDHVCVSAQFWSMRRQLSAERDKLLASLPGRSGDPGRYRVVIYTTAERILSAGMNGNPSEADGNEAFRVSYPEYFAQPGASANTCHQRLARARADVRALLKAVAG